MIGLKILSLKCFWDLVIEMVVWLFIIWVYIIVRVLYCVGLIFLGIMDELGLFLGNLSFDILDFGFELRSWILFVILNRLIVVEFKVLCVLIILLCVVSVLNLFGVVIKFNFVSFVIFCVNFFVNFCLLFSFVLMVVFFWVSFKRVGR